MKHLVVLQHGLWGNTSHMKLLADKLIGRFNQDIHVLMVKTNEGTLSYDGIDVCGERALQEIEEELKKYEFDRISLIGYSLGGLILRYAVGKMYQKGYFQKLKPMNFITIATPNLGTPKPPHSKPNEFYNAIQKKILTRVGPQFTVADDFIDSKPLLVVMADQNYWFHSALKAFQELICFTNIENDRSVRYTTGSMNSSNPYTKYESIILDPEYPEIVSFDKNRALNAKPKQISDYSRMVILGVLLPIWLVVASVALTGVAIKASNRQSKLSVDKTWLSSPKSNEDSQNRVKTPKKDSNSDDDQVVFDNDDGEDVMFNAPEGGTLARSACKHRINMLKDLNTLSWKKFDVRMNALNAHAAIVMRAPYNRPEQEGVLKFIVEVLFKVS